MKFSSVFVLFVLCIKAKGERPGETRASEHVSTNGSDELRTDVRETLTTETSKKLPKPNSLNNQLGKILQEKLNNYPIPVMRPDFYGPPIRVRVNVIIREILDISEVDMHMKLSLVLELTWVDPSLKFEHVKENVTYKYNDWVWLTENSVKDKIWIPPVSIMNEKESAGHSPRFVQESLAWTPSGLMIFRTNVVTTLSCAMSLEEFPMDTQNCSILIGSPSYRSSDVQLQVHHYFHPSFSSSARNVKLLGVRVSALTYLDGHASRTIFSFELLLERFVGYYLIGTFFPSALIVVVSWLTFWMSPDDAGEKMALGVTCVLTITTLLISVQASAPKVSYIKAVDIYMGVCFTLVFSTLLQSTAVNYLLRKLQNPGADKSNTEEEDEMIQSHGRQACTPNSGVLAVVRRLVARDLKAQEKVKVMKFILRCNLWSRVIFPLIFTVFNLAYWTFYSTRSTKFDSTKNWKPLNFFAHVLDGRP